MAERRRKREVAWRVFSNELNSAQHTIMGNEAYEPNYVVTEVGAKINRVFVTGVFTEKENVGTDDDPLWRARLIDPTGAFFISAGRFQPEAAKDIGELEPPKTLAMIGKIRTFTSDDGRMFISIRPEMVKQIDNRLRNLWILDTCKSLMRRLECLHEALKMDSASEDNLIALGYNKLEVGGILSALENYNYGQIDITHYEQQVREILQNLKDGLFDLESLPSEMMGDSDLNRTYSGKEDTSESNSADMEAKENIVRTLVSELDQDNSVGAEYQEVLKAAEGKGLSQNDTEECVNILMNKGIIFEPSLGYLKSIEQ